MSRPRQLAYPALDRGLELATAPLVCAGILDRPLYAAYELDEREYVGTIVDAGADDVRRELLAAGYEPSGLLAALKTHPGTGQPDAGPRL